mmetsp:Transcript_6571/g.9954  ORF Transcript_6571/g.9954 Transcript_6571/m.9954 type:complete len:564 (-) Transcript_6571:206-1897(-)
MIDYIDDDYANQQQSGSEGRRRLMSADDSLLERESKMVQRTVATGTMTSCFSNSLSTLNHSIGNVHTPDHSNNNGSSNNIWNLSNSTMNFSNHSGSLTFSNHCKTMTSNASGSNHSRERNRNNSKAFPRNLLGTLRTLEGNSHCVDCLEHNEQLSWASVTCGTLMCKSCAMELLESEFCHHLLSVEFGHWSFEAVLAMLEGGNGKFLQSVDKPNFVVLTKGGETMNASKENFGTPFQRYSSRATTLYQKDLARRVNKVQKNLNKWDTSIENKDDDQHNHDNTDNKTQKSSLHRRRSELETHDNADNKTQKSSLHRRRSDMEKWDSPIENNDDNRHPYNNYDDMDNSLRRNSQHRRQSDHGMSREHYKRSLHSRRSMHSPPRSPTRTPPQLTHFSSSNKITLSPRSCQSNTLTTKKRQPQHHHKPTKGDLLDVMNDRGDMSRHQHRKVHDMNQFHSSFSSSMRQHFERGPPEVIVVSHANVPNVQPIVPGGGVPLHIKVTQNDEPSLIHDDDSLDPLHQRQMQKYYHSFKQQQQQKHHSSRKHSPKGSRSIKTGHRKSKVSCNY